MGDATGPPFIGRAGELSRLRDAFRLACEERSRVVIVKGEAGVGKSTLIEHFVSSEAGAVFGRPPLVIVGHCVAPELVFVPIVEALRALASVLGSGFDDVVGVARAEVAALVPDLVDGHEATRGAGSDERLFDALCQVLSRTAGVAPLVFVVEDLQWADRATLDLLRYATLTLGAARVLLLLSIRDEDVRRQEDGSLQAWLGELARVRHVVTVPVTPLSEPESAELIESLGGVPHGHGGTDDLHARSGGNPFVLSELVAAGDRGVPPRVRDALAARRDALPAPAISAARAAAVIGPSVPHGLLAAVADLGPTELAAGLRTLIDEGIVVADEDGRPLYRFRHDLWQESVLETVLAVERADLHGRVARALEADPALLEGGPQVVAPVLAAQWQASGHRREAFGATVAAGRVLASMGLAGDAVDLFERALRLWPDVQDASSRAGTDRAGLLQEAASAAFAAGASGRAVEHQRAAATTVERNLEPARGARLDVDLGYYLLEAGELRDGVALLEVVIDGDDDRSATGWALARRAQHHLRTSRVSDAASGAARAVEIAQELGDDRLLADALTTLGAAAIDVEVLDRALEIARRIDAPGAVARLLHNKHFAVVRVNVSHEAGREVLSQYADELARPMPMAVKAGGLMTVATSLCQLGEFEQVDPLLARLPDGELTGRNGFMTLDSLFIVRLYRGEMAAATALLDQLRAIASGAGEVAMDVDIAIDSAELAFAENDPARALVDLQRALPLIAAIGDDWYRTEFELWAARSAAGIVTDHGSVRETSVAAARQLWDRVGDGLPGERLFPAYGQAIEAEVAVLAGDIDPDRFAVAASLFDDMVNVVQAGWCRVREVDAALAVGDRRRARSVTNETFHAAAEVGYGLVTRLLGDRAARAGFAIEDDPRRARPAAVGLTAREHDVLEGLAEGRSNRELAAHLFLGVRTVETHVSRLLAKLGASSRTEAVAKARELSLL